MTADPNCPGVGPNRNHPTCTMSLGTCTVPSALRPRVDTAMERPMAGIRRVRGTERAVVKAVNIGRVDGGGVLAADRMAAAEGAGAGSGWLLPRIPTKRTPAPTR